MGAAPAQRGHLVRRDAQTLLELQDGSGNAVQVSAQQLGKQVIEAERELDAAFRGRDADEQRFRDISARIGALNAELRTVHLLAHLRTMQVLTDQQVAAYNDARGYSAPADRHRH